MKIADIEQTFISTGGIQLYSVLLRNLSQPFELNNILVHHEELEAGMNASKPHYHTHKEELVVVLEGKITVNLEGKTRVLGPGEFFGFGCDSGSSHYISNRSASVARYLSIATVTPDDETIFT